MGHASARPPGVPAQRPQPRLPLREALIHRHPPDARAVALVGGQVAEMFAAGGEAAANAQHYFTPQVVARVRGLQHAARSPLRRTGRRVRV